MVKQSKTTSETSVVRYGTTKQKVNYEPAGVASYTKDKKQIIVYLNNGDKLLISKPISEKQYNYFKERTAEGYVDHKDINSIYAYSTLIVKHIKEVDYNEDLQAAHKNEVQKATAKKGGDK